MQHRTIQIEYDQNDM